jgi:WD40 repeat protein
MPDGSSLVTTSAIGELTWWDLDSRETTRVIDIPDGLRALAISPDGRTAAIGLDDGIELIDVRTGEVAREARRFLPSRPNWLRFSPDGSLLVSTSRAGPVTVWDVDTLTPVETLRGHADSVWQPVFSADGETLYTASHDGSAIAWDLGQDRRFERRFTFTHDRGLSDYPDVHPGAFSPDGQLIAVGLKQDGIQLWNVGDLAPIGDPLGPTGGEVVELAFSSDGRTLAVASESVDGDIVTVWDVETRSLSDGPFPGGVSLGVDGTLLATMSDERVRELSIGALLGGVTDAGAEVGVAFRPTEPLVTVGRSVGRDIEIIEIWDASRHSLLTTIRLPGVSPIGWAVAFSEDQRMLAAGGLHPLVHVWDVRTGELIREIEQNVGAGVWSVQFTPDGTMLAVSGADGFASLYDVATGVQVGPRLGIGGRESMLDISADGNLLLLTNGDGTGAIWPIDPESWAQRACELANRTLTPEEWEEFLPGTAYEPACGA